MFEEAKKRTKCVMLILTIIVAVLAIVGAYRILRGKVEKERPTIRIAIDYWPGYGYAFIAKETGIFQKNGVNVELIVNQIYKQECDLYLNGKVDGIFLTFADIILFDSEAIRSKIVYAADYSDTSDVIIANPKINSVSELKGKTVSFAGVNTFSHLFVLEALRQAGVKEADVKFVNLDVNEVLGALDNGTIDAGHIWEPFKSDALKKGYKVIETAGNVPNIITDLLAFSAKIVKEKPADIKAIVKSLIEARNYLLANNDKAIEIISRAQNNTEPSKIISGINGAHLYDLKDNLIVLNKSSGSKSLESKGQRIAELLMERGQLAKPTNWDELIEPRFVNEVAGEMKGNK